MILITSRANAVCQALTYTEAKNGNFIKYAVVGTVIAKSEQPLTLGGVNVGRTVYTVQVIYTNYVKPSLLAPGESSPVAGTTIQVWKPGASLFDFSVDYPIDPPLQTVGFFAVSPAGNTIHGGQIVNCQNGAIQNLTQTGSCYYVPFGSHSSWITPGNKVCGGGCSCPSG